MTETGPSTDEEPFAQWLDSPIKARLVAFYQQNPGVIETLDGLARRLGTTPAALEEAVRAHVDLGLLRQIGAPSHPILLFNRSRQTELARLIAKAAGRALWREGRA